MSAHAHAALIIEWSPGRVRVFDVATQRSTYGVSLVEALVGHSGRSAVFALSRSSVFIRSLLVPNASRAEIRRVLEVQILRELPFAPGEFVFDFRLSEQATAQGKVAVVGALKTELLNRIYEEAREAGIRVLAVVPVAFGSWLAAKSHSIREGAVVDLSESTLNIDILNRGELWYSRSVPAPLDSQGAEDEISRTFSISETTPGAVLALAGSGAAADTALTMEPISLLADAGQIEKQLFSFELPSRVEARRQRAENWERYRAIAAGVVALGLAGYVGFTRFTAQSAIDKDVSKANTKLLAANKKLATVTERANQIGAQKRVLDLAFKPGQNLSDVISVVASLAPAQSWLTSASVGRGRPLNLTGITCSDEEVSAFTSELSKSPRFRDVKVVSINRGVIGKKPVTEFALVGVATGTMSFDKSTKLASTGGSR